MSDTPFSAEASSDSSDEAMLQIDDLCIQFESAWSADAALKKIAALVDGFRPAEEKPRLLRELVATDCELRSQRGLEIFPERFVEAFPTFASTVYSAIEMWKETEFASGEPAGPNDAAPDNIGGYKLVREIGRGGGSVVYEALQPDLLRRVALKTYALNPARFHEQRQRFELEAKTASRLEHENIVSVYDSGEDCGVLFYVMQLVDGVSLHELIRATQTGATGSASAVTGNLTSTVSGNAPAAGNEQERTDDVSPSGDTGGDDGFTLREDIAHPLTGTGGASGTPPEAGGARFDTPSYKRSAQMITQAASALEFAHQRGVLHRDVKPSNLLLDKTGMIRLTDFGLARVRDSDNDLTETGNIVGSLRYLPPEAFEGMRDERGDVYGLGLTLFELLTGQPAFANKDRAELIRSICDYDVRSPRQLDGPFRRTSTPSR